MSVKAFLQEAHRVLAPNARLSLTWEGYHKSIDTERLFSDEEKEALRVIARASEKSQGYVSTDTLVAEQAFRSFGLRNSFRGSPQNFYRILSDAQVSLEVVKGNAWELQRRTLFFHGTPEEAACSAISLIPMNSEETKALPCAKPIIGLVLRKREAAETPLGPEDERLELLHQDAFPYKRPKA